jgi:ABC-type nitrate/sulfonate/bicarbonate transport system substrate-binding protein
MAQVHLLCLTVREELINEQRPMVQDLVRLVLGAGVWLDAQQANRDKAVAIAAGRDFEIRIKTSFGSSWRTDRPRDLWGLAHHQIGVPGADAAFARGRNDQAPHPVRNTWTSFATNATPAVIAI